MKGLREDIHLLTWYGHYSMSDILDMTPREREWFIDRLIKQAKSDAAAAKRG